MGMSKDFFLVTPSDAAGVSKKSAMRCSGLLKSAVRCSDLGSLKIATEVGGMKCRVAYSFNIVKLNLSYDIIHAFI